MALPKSSRSVACNSPPTRWRAYGSAPTPSISTPRDPEGRETLDERVVDAVVRPVRSAAGVPVGVSTGAWIEPAPRAPPPRSWLAGGSQNDVGQSERIRRRARHRSHELLSQEEVLPHST